MNKLTNSDMDNRFVKDCIISSCLDISIITKYHNDSIFSIKMKMKTCFIENHDIKNILLPNYLFLLRSLSFQTGGLLILF